MSYMGKFLDISAAADFLGNGAIEVNRYEDEIVDLVRRESIALQRFDAVPATGHPHRYFEQTAIATAAFTDPRAISPTPSGPTRVERAAFIKALTAQTNLSLFDVDVTRMQGQFASVEAKDIEDIVSAILIQEGTSVWNGNDTSLSSPTTIQYMGLLNQIPAGSVSVGAGASIIDGLKAQVAAMAANVTYRVRPTAIYLNPILGDYIDREAKAAKIELKEMVVAGVTVNAIETQAGRLPLIADPYMPTTTDTSFGYAAPASGFKNYFAVVTTEKEIEMPYVHGGDGNKNPRVFQLGLLAGLQGQYVAVHFNTVIAKAASYAHAVVLVVRP
ncbi:hypothetical protein [Rhizobium lusitanum]|uniref:hypothetical protein n=1 Tax=Rhizobium lusitanum TaxID=293958 RepID=UPI0019599E1E|nr:hypothetical protein [Rhizobium lusitanum]MBM7045434.1 hypothetical protein [Rhizobium lusitanum]